MKTIIKIGLASTVGVSLSCLACYYLFRDVHPEASLVGILPGLLILQLEKDKAA